MPDGYILRYVLPVPKRADTFVLISKVQYNQRPNQEENTWTWHLIFSGSGCWWDPKAQWWPMTWYTTEGTDESIEIHGDDPKVTFVYVTYSMNTWEDIGGSDMWVREYLSDDPYLYDVYHAPLKKRWNNLWTPMKDWSFMYQDIWYSKKAKKKKKAKKAKKATE